MMKKQIIIRNTLQKDISEIAELQKKSFPDLNENSIWKEHHLAAHLKIFPAGQYCAVYDGKIVGSCSSFITRFMPKYKNHTWLEACGDFSLCNHNPKGDTLYNADISVHPSFQRMQIATKMNAALKELTMKLELQRILTGSRMYNYYKFSNEMSPNEYTKKVQSGKLIDPVLSFHLNNDFKLIKILPNYLPDSHSLNYGVLVEWKNPNYKFC